MAFGDMPQMMQMLPMPQMKPAGGGGGMNDMGMKLLQAALKQPGQGGPPAAQPQVGATMPGGAMNIVPQVGGGGLGGMGLLSMLLSGKTGGAASLLGGGGGLIPPLTSGNALY